MSCFTSASSCLGSGCKTNGECTYKCLIVDQNSDKLVVLVEFGTYKSEEELASGGYTTADLAGYPNETGKWPSVLNNQVTSLGRITLASTVTTFIVSGGNAVIEYSKGKVSSIIVEFDLVGNVSDQSFSNALLTKFPTEIRSLQVLKELVLDNNYMTTVDSVEGMDSIATLSMQNNNIDRFTANFTKLKNLNLTGNPFASRGFTSKQASFLNSLETLGLSAADFSADADCGNLRKSFIFVVAVCIIDDGSLSPSAKAKDVSAASASSDSDGSDVNTIASSSSPSSTGLIVGIACGVFTVLLAAFVFVIQRRKQQKKSDVSIASDIVAYTSDQFSSTDNWHQVLLQSRGRRASSEVDLVVSRSSSSSDVSVGISTSANEINENFEALDVTPAVFSIPSFVSTEKADVNEK
ncbi:unnamed protein product [Peronospora destructor]|uniref:Uncharacterized protein n=1 Tax=Peronospora destructor TaxID=86335 RepID=A0AAV0VFR7_9STRA|nr:unnamed protein product [Peronospora destructor]